jgi:proline dehydrogenase
MSLFNRLVASTLPLIPKPIVRRVADPYIAGEKLSDLLRVATQLNRDGYLVAAAVLGEFVERKEEAAVAVQEYEEVLEALHTAHVDGYIHVKPTHLGLKIDRDLCEENVRKLLTVAKGHGLFVRLDMEDSPCIDDTIEVFLNVRREFDNVGAVLQARMRRSIADARRLAAANANIRVCKGIYLEPYHLAYTDPDVINRNYMALVEDLLGAGCYVAIATHDERLVWEASRLVDRMGLNRDQYEFQMLLGVRKNPTIAGYVLKSLFTG